MASFWLVTLFSPLQVPSVPPPASPLPLPQLPPPHPPPAPPHADTCTFPDRLLQASLDGNEEWYCCNMAELSNVAVLGHFSPPPPPSQPSSSSPPPTPPSVPSQDAPPGGRRLAEGAPSAPGPGDARRRLTHEGPPAPPTPSTPPPPPPQPPQPPQQPPQLPPPSAPASCEAVRLFDLLDAAESQGACRRTQAASSPPPTPPAVRAHRPLVCPRPTRPCPARRPDPFGFALLARSPSPATGLSRSSPTTTGEPSRRSWTGWKRPSSTIPLAGFRTSKIRNGSSSLAS